MAEQTSQEELYPIDVPTQPEEPLAQDVVDYTQKGVDLLAQGEKASVVRQRLAKYNSNNDFLDQVMSGALSDQIVVRREAGVPEDVLKEQLVGIGAISNPESLNRALGKYDPIATIFGDPNEAHLEERAEDALAGIIELGKQPVAGESVGPELIKPDRLYDINGRKLTAKQIGNTLMHYSEKYGYAYEAIMDVTGTSIGSQTAAMDMKLYVADEMRLAGVESAKVDSQGKLVYIDANDETQYVDDALYQVAMRAPEFAGALTGSAAGLKACGPAATAHKGVALGCAAAGSVVGVASAVGLGDVWNSYVLDKSMDVSRTAKKMLGAGLDDAIIGLSTAGALKGLEWASTSYNQVWNVMKTAASRKWGSTRKLLEEAGLTYEEATVLTRDYFARLGKNVSGDNMTKQMTDMVVNTMDELKPYIGAGAKVIKAKGFAARHIKEKSDQIIEMAQDMTSGNIGRVVPNELRLYERHVKDSYKQMKETGVSAVTETEQATGKKFTFDPNLATNKVFESIEKNITNDTVLREYLNVMENVKGIGGRATRDRIALGAAEKLEQAKGVATQRAAVGVEAGQAKAGKAVVSKVRGYEAVQTVDDAQKAIVSVGKRITSAEKAAVKNKTQKGRDAAAARVKKLTADRKGLKTYITNLRSDERLAKGAEAVEGAETAAIIGQQKAELKATEAGLREGVKRDIASAPEMAEAENALRGFRDLMDLRNVVNQVRFANKFKGAIAPHKQALTSAVEDIDKALYEGARKFMPDGDAWIADNRLQNAAYSQMKKIQENTVYKTLIKEGSDPEQIVKELYKSAPLSDDILMRVKEKLPKNLQRTVDGAIMNHAVDKATTEGVIDLVGLNLDLKRIPFASTESRQLKLAVAGLADVEKNNPYIKTAIKHAQKALPNTDVKGMLGTTVLGKADQELTAITYGKIKSWVPFTDAANIRKIVHYTAEVMENPMKASAQRQYLNIMRDDPAAKNVLRQRQIEYAKYGEEKLYSRPEIYSVSATGEARRGNTRLGKGKVFLADKAKAQAMAKQKGMKMKSKKVFIDNVITIEDASKLVGRKLTAKDMQSNAVQHKLRRLNIEGLADGNEILMFD